MTLLRTRGIPQPLCEGLVATARVILLAMGMDLIYQLIGSGPFSGRGRAVAMLLAFIPYLLSAAPSRIRALVTRRRAPVTSKCRVRCVGRWSAVVGVHWRNDDRGRADGEQTRFTVRTTAEAHFAWLRTRLAIERTMLAWMRTAVSLIGFGFAIVQFFDRLQRCRGRRGAFARCPEIARASR